MWYIVINLIKMFRILYSDYININTIDSSSADKCYYPNKCIIIIIIIIITTTIIQLIVVIYIYILQ